MEIKPRWEPSPGFEVRHFGATVRHVDTEKAPASYFAAGPGAQATKAGTIGNAPRAKGAARARRCAAERPHRTRSCVCVESVRSTTSGKVKLNLDWFDISMRRRHLEQALAGLLGSDLQHKAQPTYAEEGARRLRHVIWNGYDNEARPVRHRIAYMTDNATWLNSHSGRSRIERFAELARKFAAYVALNAAVVADHGRRYRADLRIAT